MRRYLRDVADHNLQASDRVDGFSQILRDMLTVNATLVAQKQNEEMRALTEASHAQGIEVKKISAWAAILFAPTLIGTAYGMNFASMPGLDSPHGFTMAMALMVATCVVLLRRVQAARLAVGATRPAIASGAGYLRTFLKNLSRAWSALLRAFDNTSADSFFTFAGGPSPPNAARTSAYRASASRQSV